jgi:hypothetical protein
MTASEIITAASFASGALAHARMNGNEVSAIATLKIISSAQAQCQASGVIDANSNGAGEYGSFGELSGHTVVRGGTVCIVPPILSDAFGSVTAARVSRSGYVFQMFLPNAQCAGVAEAPTGGGSGVSIDAQQAERLWCCYAWPQAMGDGGRRMFFVNQCGDVLATSGAAVAYNGSVTTPKFDAAFVANDSSGMAARVAVNSVGQDGNTWVVVQ